MNTSQHGLYKNGQYVAQPLPAQMNGLPLTTLKSSQPRPNPSPSPATSSNHMANRYRQDNAHVESKASSSISSSSSSSSVSLSSNANNVYRATHIQNVIKQPRDDRHIRNHQNHQNDGTSFQYLSDMFTYCMTTMRIYLDARRIIFHCKIFFY